MLSYWKDQGGLMVGRLRGGGVEGLVHLVRGWFWVLRQGRAEMGGSLGVDMNHGMVISNPRLCAGRCSSRRRR